MTTYSITSKSSLPDLSKLVDDVEREAILNPNTSMLKRDPARSVRSAQESPPNTALNAVINTNVVSSASTTNFRGLRARFYL